MRIELSPNIFFNLMTNLTHAVKHFFFNLVYNIDT